MATRKKTTAASDILGQIAALVPNTQAPKPGKASKWEMELTAAAKQDAIRWISAKTIHEAVNSRMENAKNDFSAYATRLMAEKLFANKTKPSNPLVVIKNDAGKPDHQFQFTMTDKFKYRFPEVPEGVDPRDHFIDIFEQIGLHPSEAEKLVDNELDFNPITSLKPLTELMEGVYGAGREWIDASEYSKKAGQKLAALLMWQDGEPAPAPLSLAEKAMVIQRSAGMVVKAGFYDRVATYCTTVDQLMGIFQIIQPIAYPASPKFGINDSETDKTRRKIESAADIIGSMSDEAAAAAAE